MRILVTGGSSKIGQKLVNHLESRNFSVVALQGRNSEVWRLGEQLPTNPEFDVLIHLAHDKNFSISDNLKAMKKLVHSFNGHVSFLSTMSAHSESKSKYGISKFYMEKIVIESGGTVLRAGIIVGPNVGGIYETIQSYIKKFPIIFLPYKGNSRFYVTQIDDLINEIEYLIERKSNTIIMCANRWPITFHKLVKDIMKLSNIKTKKIFGIPNSLTNFCVLLLSKIYPNNPSLDSLKSLKNEINPVELNKLEVTSVEFRHLM